MGALSVVIPVWNDARGLQRLLPQLLALPQVAQIVVSDDASKPPARETGGISDPRILWLESPAQKGAGAARNSGLAQVSSPHVLFFDSDDLPLPGLAALLEDLDRPETPDFDFCLFSHVDSRMRARGIPGPLESDAKHWQLARANLGFRPAPIPPETAARLCRISAYPWNKIYRTGFLLENGIRCTEIMVHNDVELHWQSFYRARNILVSTQTCAEHFVAEDGARLTNRSGAERFEVFRALEPLAAALREDRQRADRFAEPTADFYMQLLRWIDTVLEPGLRGPFAWKARAFVQAAITPPLFTLIAQRNPGLAARINHFLSGGPA
ncbi:glycosyltransferase family A protein [Gemmobacter denitrificans]|uniref:Glycosyltransferase family A protein n=1 Tax=Gemmobacter denitrificans TaxID=3123040 RepID=A0ABU8C0G4_9RHOB